MKLNAKEVAIFNKRMELAKESREEFKRQCEAVAQEGKDIQEKDFSHYCYETLKKYADDLAVYKEKQRRRDLGFFGRRGEDLGNFFSSVLGFVFGRFLRKVQEDKAMDRAQHAAAAIGTIFTTPDQYTEAVDDTQFTHVLWRIMFETSDGNIDVQEGETEVDAIRRIVRNNLEQYRDACDKDEVPCQDSGRWDDAVQGDGEGDVYCGDKKVTQPEDPLLEYAKKAKLKELLAKDETDKSEKRIIDDAMSGQDIVVLD